LSKEKAVSVRSTPVKIRLDDIDGKELGSFWASITDFDLEKENFSIDEMRQLKAVRDGLRLMSSGRFHFRITDDNRAVKSLAEKMAALVKCLLVPKDVESVAGKIMNAIEQGDENEALCEIVNLLDLIFGPNRVSSRPSTSGPDPY
jgi:hypothetical protein